MNESLLLAKIIGVIFFTLSFILLINKSAFEIFINLLKSKEFILLSGIILFSAGVLILTFHNKWEINWKGVLTLTGWLIVMEGLIRILFINSIQKLIKQEDAKLAIKVSLFITLIIGAYLLLINFL